MIRTVLSSNVVAVLLVVAGAPAQSPPSPANETAIGRSVTICRPVEDLEPNVGGGTLESVRPELGATGSLSRWSAVEGDTLQLKVRTVEPGMYEISIRAVHGAEGPTPYGSSIQPSCKSHCVKTLDLLAASRLSPESGRHAVGCGDEVHTALKLLTHHDFGLG